MEFYLPIAEMSINPIGFLVLGIIVGTLSGTFGVGGGFLMTPLLIFLGIPPAIAVASEANHIVGSSLSGTIGHLRRKAVDIRMGNVLLAGGILGSFLGIYIFNSLKQVGLVDLLITASYFLFLTAIGFFMLYESLDSLEIRGNGVYVDMTYGGGGHSREILNRLGSNGKLIAFDQDLDSQSNIIDDERLIFFRQNNILSLIHI